MKRKKNILSLENKKRGKYPCLLLRTSIIIEIIAKWLLEYLLADTALSMESKLRQLKNIEIGSIAFFKSEVSSDWKMSDDDNDDVVFIQRTQQSILRKKALWSPSLGSIKT
jgi:hypothetical protein